MKKLLNIQELLHHKSKHHGTKPMHPSSLRAFQRHQAHDLKRPSSLDLITTKRNKPPSFINGYTGLHIEHARLKEGQKQFFLFLFVLVIFFARRMFFILFFPSFSQFFLVLFLVLFFISVFFPQGAPVLSFCLFFCPFCQFFLFFIIIFCYFFHPCLFSHGRCILLFLLFLFFLYLFSFLPFFPHGLCFSFSLSPRSTSSFLLFSFHYFLSLLFFLLFSFFSLFQVGCGHLGYGD